MRRPTLFPILLVLAASTACDGSRRPAGMEETDAERIGLTSPVEFRADVRFLDSEQAATATIRGDTLVLPLDDNPWLDELSVGDVLWSPEGGVWEERFARRIESVEDRGATVVLVTSVVDTDEVFAEPGVVPEVARPQITRPAASSPEDGASLSEVAEALGRFYPDTLLGLPETPASRSDFDDQGLEMGPSGFESASKSWMPPQGGDVSRIYVQVISLAPRSGGFGWDPAAFLAEPGWYEARVAGRALPRRDRMDPHGIDLLGDGVAVVISGVDHALLQDAARELDLQELSGLAPADALGPADAAEPSVRDSARAAELRSLLPYRLGGLPRAGRTVLFDGDGVPFQARAIWAEDPFDEEGARLTLEVVDRRSRRADMARTYMSGAGWEFVSLGRDDGVGSQQRTLTSRGPGGEIMTGTGELRVYLRGRNMDMAQVRAAFDDVDLDRLIALATPPREDDGP